MIRVTLLGCVAAALTVADGCRRARGGSESASARRYAVEHAAVRDELARLPRCALPTPPDTAGWRRPGGAAVALPPDFRPDTAPPRYMHGGQRWTAGPWQYEEVVGHWGLTSFSAGARCRLTLDGRDAMYQRREHDGRQSEIVWLPDTAQVSIGSVLYAAAGPAGVPALLARAVQTHVLFVQ